MTRVRGEAGGAEALGVVMMMPLMIGLALIVVAIGRDVDLRAEVAAVSAAAATAAAHQRSPGAAVDIAEEIAHRVLADSSICRHHRIDTDLDRFVPGGVVIVTIECDMETNGLDDLLGARPPIIVTARASIDPYKAMP